MSYLFNLYKYIYYNFCIYKNDDDNNNDDNNNDENYIYDNIDINQKVDLDKMIISSLVCNNIEIPFFEIKTFNSQCMKK